MDNFFNIEFSTLSENEQIALFRLFGNFATLSDSACEVNKHYAEIFEFATQESAAVRRQAWTILLNLSCDPFCTNTMLESSVRLCY